MDTGTLLLMLGISYGPGVLWYDLLPGKIPARPWRVAAYPFLGIFSAEALVGGKFADFAFGGLHLIALLAGSLVAVVIDWIADRVERGGLLPREHDLTPAHRRRAARPGESRRMGSAGPQSDSDNEDEGEPAATASADAE